MALAVCLLFDPPSDRALRATWRRLEEHGVPSLASHTHGRHVPHVSLAVLRSWEFSDVMAALADLGSHDPVLLEFDGLGLFRRGRVWLVSGVSSDLVLRQERLVSAVSATGADLHKHYRPGFWVPHCSLAPRAPLVGLDVVAKAVYDVLPLHARLDHAALINSSTGESWPLPVMP